MMLVAVNDEGQEVGSVNAPDGNNWVTDQVVKMRARRRASGLPLDARDVAERGVRLLTAEELDALFRFIRKPAFLKPTHAGVA